MKKKYFWKIMSTNLKSCHMSTFADQKKLIVSYKVNSFIKPRIVDSKLMVFNTCLNAIRFRNSYDSTCLIFKCEVKNPTLKKSMLHSGAICNDAFTYEDIRNFWIKTKGHIRKYNDIQDTPMGTYVCDAVKLIKEIK